MLAGPPSLIKLIDEFALDGIHVERHRLTPVGLFQRGSDVYLYGLVSIIEFPIKLHCLDRESSAEAN
jgi:hypothetical protein